MFHQKDTEIDCTPEMISKYVDGPLKEKLARKAAAAGIKAKAAEMSNNDAKKLK